MKQISKKDLIRLITESQKETSEMAHAGQEWDPTHSTKYRFQPDAKQGDPLVVNPDFKPKKPKPGAKEPKAIKAKPFWTHLPDLTTDQNEVDVWLSDADLTNDKNQKIAVVFTHGVPIDEWKNTNKEYINTVILPEVGGNEQQIRYFLDDKLKFWKLSPSQLQKYLTRDTFYGSRDISEREIILRILQADARKILETPTRDFLLRNGFPPIELPKQITGDQKTSINSETGTFTNKEIDWQWHKRRTFDTPEKFFKDINLMIDRGGEGVEAKVGNLKRQFLNRSSRRGSFIGKEIVTRNDMHIEGMTTNGGGYKWKITFSAYVGQGEGEGEKPPIGLVMVGGNYVPDESTGKMKLLPHVVTTNSGSSEIIDGSVLNNPEVRKALDDAFKQVEQIILNKITLSNLLSSAYLAVKGTFEAFDDDPNNTMAQPELEPQAAGAEKPKKGKKITKEAIESMIKNMLHEAINK
jgi:hypothetical protein